MSQPPLTTLAAAVLHLARAPERVLEIGCGEGDAVLFLAREFPQARVRGLDASAATVRAAVARVGLDPEGRVAFKAGRPGSLPYPDDHFDLVVCRHGPPSAREAARVLRSGGCLLYLEPQRRGTARLRLAWSEWTLAQRGFETLRHEEAAGARFWLGRLAST
ncbi:MAG TPA: class I SAM-dependent methyltransferase [Solirubrobacterales bacterium]|nr:class I SAM-dependent methyltransferase [Solirubrobacterales bacterium]